MANKSVLLVGNVVEGIRAYGPVNEKRWEEMCDIANYLDEQWCIITVQSMSDLDSSWNSST